MMSRTISASGVAILFLIAASGAAQRPAPRHRVARLRAPQEAARRVERAVLRLELFDQVEHPTAVRRLEDETAVTRARLAMHQREVAEYSRYDKVLYSKPLFLSLELAKLDVVAARTQLESLQREKLLIVQHRSQRRRILQLEIDSAVEQQRLSERREAAKNVRNVQKTPPPVQPREKLQPRDYKPRAKQRRRRPIIEARLRTE